MPQAIEVSIAKIETHMENQGKILDKIDGTVDTLVAKTIEQNGRIAKNKDSIETVKGETKYNKNLIWRLLMIFSGSTFLAITIAKVVVEVLK